ncbi:histidinol dehydrogenase [Marinivivus vitaminiproducens]|uniref:histidinol dehydrogenase n=1 Tax=Marinivivus vitaminiproducens TaxID=3035935 RepID=UPI0027A95696|nr:histidinol dehydrogenase [Geminicoccaceae bacterium SCSIO 64248]
MTDSIRLIELAAITSHERAALMRRTEADLDDLMPKVDSIIAAVREEGDAALARFAQLFDRAPVEAHALKATEADFERAQHSLAPDVKAAIDYAVENIRTFHRAQLPESMWLKEIRPGAYAGEVARPIPSVACYVPRGKGAFPSVTMMTTIPAVVAGVPRIIVLTPPGPDGRVDDATLVACAAAGVREVYMVGGAQAVAAAAYGTATIPRVDKIIGPGSPWVVAAKRRLSHRLDTGLPAGPSEALILADGTANGALAGLDLLIEAEHGPDSSAYLVTDSREVAEAAIAAIPGYWQTMGDQRVDFSRTVLSGPRGGVVLAPDLDAAIAFVNDYAPEHLSILSDTPFDHLGRIDNAAEILLGHHSVLTLGNFLLGPNCVLPTGGHARTWSPLSVHDFMKRCSIGYVTGPGYAELARHARVLATYEGFEAHANAVSPTRDRILNGRAS